MKDWLEIGGKLYRVRIERDYDADPTGDYTYGEFTASQKGDYPVGIKKLRGDKKRVAQKGEVPDLYWSQPDAPKDYTRAMANEWAKDACDLHNQWTDGEVYGWVCDDITDQDNHTHVDSCWGYYGYDAAFQDGLEFLQGLADQAKG